MIKEMKIADILCLPSVDSEACCSGDMVISDRWLAANAISRKTLFDDDPDYPVDYQWLIDRMKADGYNRVPIHVDLGSEMIDVYCVDVPSDLLDSLMMGNGHHRLMIAIQLGFDTMLVTDDVSESDDVGDWSSFTYDEDRRCSTDAHRRASTW